MQMFLRGVAQSGLARMVRVHEVGGSNPLAPIEDNKAVLNDKISRTAFLITTSSRTKLQITILLRMSLIRKQGLKAIKNLLIQIFFHLDKIRNLNLQAVL